MTQRQQEIYRLRLLVQRKINLLKGPKCSNVEYRVRQLTYKQLVELFTADNKDILITLRLFERDKKIELFRKTMNKTFPGGLLAYLYD